MATNWRLPWRRLDEAALTEAAVTLAGTMEDVTASVESEEEDGFSCLFHVDEPGDPYTIELSIYDLEGGFYVMSLEEDWSDNHEAWDAACDLADRLAELLGAWEIDLE